jgi:hypothetical protein
MVGNLGWPSNTWAIPSRDMPLCVVTELNRPSRSPRPRMPSRHRRPMVSETADQLDILLRRIGPRSSNDKVSDKVSSPNRAVDCRLQEKQNPPILGGFRRVSREGLEPSTG